MKKYIFILIFFALPQPCLLALQPNSFAPSSSYTVCFTPGENCTQEIVNAIDMAKSSLYIQTYSITSRPIINAIAQASLRGLIVNMLVDKSVPNDNQELIWYLNKNNVKTWVEYMDGIAHNKCMIIDEAKVITGSFNFTYSAQNRNAENLLIINDSSLAKKYINNWYKLKNENAKLIKIKIKQKSDASNLDKIIYKLIALIKKIIFA